MEFAQRGSCFQEVLSRLWEGLWVMGRNGRRWGSEMAHVLEGWKGEGREKERGGKRKRGRRDRKIRWSW